MKTYTLQTPFLTATFSSKGAELIGLKDAKREYIWSGDAQFWGRQTPVLFPIVGSLKNNQYTYQGKTYTLGQHGFARDMEFEVVVHTDTSIVFELKETATTLENYPFAFVLQIEYTLANDRLTTCYKVKNPSKETLYFSIGGHPAFNCPMEKEHQRNEYFLLFDNESSPETTILHQGLRTDQKEPVFDIGGMLDITEHVFDKDALIFNPNPFQSASIVHDETGDTYLTVHFENFPYVGIWSKNSKSPFVCIEPWYGIADHENHQQDLTKKEGIISLTSSQDFECAYTIQVYL